MSKTFTGWRTPKGLFDPLHWLLGFEVDAAADQSNHLLPKWYGEGGIEEDALSVSQWLSPAWCNPPYGNGIELWLEKFIEQGKLGVSIMALLPARVETRWWSELVVPHANIIFLTGRVPFERPDREKPSQPDHASALLCYGDLTVGQVSWLDWRKRFEQMKGAMGAVQAA